MADIRPQSLSGSSTRIKTGANSILDLAKSVTDPVIAVLCLYFSAWVWGEAFGPGEMVLALITFSLMYPGSVPFAYQQRKLLRQLASQWGLVLGLLLLFGLVGKHSCCLS